MNIQTLKKTYTCVATAVLLGKFTVAPSSSYATEKKQDTQTEQQSQKDVVTEKKGFMGYYFTDKQFKDMILMAPVENGELKVTKEEVKDLLNAEQQNIQSVRWMGYIKPSESGEYQFSTSSDRQVIMNIDGNTVMNQSPMEEKIKLEKDKTYEVRIEYVPENKDKKDNLVDLQLFWAISDKEKEIIPKKNMLSPDFSRKNNKNKLIPDENLFDASNVSGASSHRTKRSLPPKSEALDTDDDSIPDVWEENGYTIQHQLAVKWDDKFAENGYKKYRSNPYEAHTVGDPYTDIQKATGKIDGATKKEAKNPLVAAYPNIGVNMESIVISKNQEVIESHGGEASNTISASTSNSKTDETSKGIDASVSATIHASFFDFGESVTASVSTSFNESHSSTATIENSNSNTSGTNWSQTVGMHTGDAAYLGARIRYVNTGTAPAYKVKPTMSLGFGENTTLATVKAKENQTANKLIPGELYPMKNSLPILLNKVDDFGSTPISINLNQLNELENIKKVQLDSPQYDAMVGANGHMAQEDWNGYITEINQRTARFVFLSPEEEVERRVAAKIDPMDSEDAYPEITVEEALNIAVDGFKKTKDGYQYGDYTFKTLHFIYDEATAEKLKEQANKEKDRKLDPMKLKLNAKMNIQVSPKGWVTNSKTNKKYYYDDKGIIVIGEKEIDGKKHYFDEKGLLSDILLHDNWITSGDVNLSPDGWFTLYDGGSKMENKVKLRPNTTYTMSVSIRLAGSNDIVEFGIKNHGKSQETMKKKGGHFNRPTYWEFTTGTSVSDATFFIRNVDSWRVDGFDFVLVEK
ncbi:binary toxin-like calcium binding domain-containing protein [Bacillus mycoides]|uniref:binary toxin-like calcium binding domain-containing protein n=1 Tax=Bacillus mycoides TaxID=1405 RepID=UPI0021136B09|nr:binary toxin-like calcium binding domain-containing protein [Bacillus mycoides]MCQ6530922.1 PA14 domain-containing protein [Bacillus mycoides]